MSRFTMIAEEIKRKDGGKDVNSQIKKYASENSLNKNETQRLVEEVNLANFLDKLREGTQYKDFNVADPVVTHDDSNLTLAGAELNKAASLDYKNYINDAMFNISRPEEEYFDNLEKTASVSIGNEIFTSEEKWERNKHTVNSLLGKEAELKQIYTNEDEINENIYLLMKTASASEGMLKTASILVAKNIGEEYFEDMIENSKYSPSDIINAKAETLSKEASNAFESLMQKVAKENPVVSTAKDGTDVVKNTGKAVGSAAKFLYKHPIVSAGTALGLYYLNSRRADEPQKQRLQMMADSYEDKN